MKLGSIVSSISSGQILSRVEAKEEAGDTVIDAKSVLVPKAISGGKVVHADLGTVKLKKAVEEERITKAGDIVMKLSTPYDAALIEAGDEDLIIPSFCIIIRGLRPNQADPLFITAYLNTDHVRHLLRTKVAGTAMPMIKLGDVRDLEIPEVSLVKQELVGEAYLVSSKKMNLLQEMMENEQMLMNHIMLKVVKEAES